MKRSVLSGCILLALGLAEVQAATVDVELSPAASVVNAGDVFNVSILGHAPSVLLAGGGISLAFDPAILKANSIAVNPAIGDFIFDNGAIDNSAGTITDAGFASWFGVTGDFTLATVSFTALHAGTSALTLGDASLVWTWAAYNIGGVSTDLAVSYTGGSVSVDAVPLPAAAWLFVPAVAGLVGRRRKEAA